jgi:hypothetical protein
LAQGKLREESHRINKIDNRNSSLPAGGQGLMPQNDIATQSPRGRVGKLMGRIKIINPAFRRGDFLIYFFKTTSKESRIFFIS